MSLNNFQNRHTNLAPRLPAILKKISEETKGDFIPNELIWQSNYFGSTNIGAAHYSGTYQDKPAVLKIQGVKPTISEAWMIEQFAAHNQSRLIRPPHLHHHIAWDDQSEFEALIMEQVSGPKILPSQQPVAKKQLQTFLKVYLEYRANCRTVAWITNPNHTSKTLAKHSDESLQERLVLAEEINPNSPLRQDSDQNLASAAYQELKNLWTAASIDFQHGHFSAEDLIKSDGQYILFSNLFWKWTHPYYDAVFAHHWHRISLTHNRNLGPEDLNLQNQLWHQHFFNHLNADPKLLTAALLERSIAGLLVDAPAYASPDHPTTIYLMNVLRREIRTFAKMLSS